MVDRYVVFLCILHSRIAVGVLQMAFIEAPLVDLQKENAEAVQRGLYRARTGSKLGASATPQGEEACTLFLLLEEIEPMLDYVPDDGEWQAVVAMRTSSGICTRTPSSFIASHGHIDNEADVARHAQSKQSTPGVLCMCPLACVFRLIFASLSLIPVD